MIPRRDANDVVHLGVNLLDQSTPSPTRAQDNDPGLLGGLGGVEPGILGHLGGEERERRADLWGSG